ncbi:hypothetical protein POM88_002266 [Heracleum sosnowskyi]|uniref:Pullulanase N2 domain-containing protein n=1 Tax=Heracleum sosnowskyi TaxID=360622 RepID=A0AAD8NBM1_9APIA|nr:hypothetical protein POM88_002266 [Heracleum sosnowskyi]
MWEWGRGIFTNFLETFKSLLEYWGDETVQERARKNAESRSKIVDTHTASPKCFSQLKHKMKKKRPDDGEPSQGRVFIKTRKRRAGRKYQTDPSVINYRIEKIKKNLGTSGEDIQELITDGKLHGPSWLIGRSSNPSKISATAPKGTYVQDLTSKIRESLVEEVEAKVSKKMQEEVDAQGFFDLNSGLDLGFKARLQFVGIIVFLLWFVRASICRYKAYKVPPALVAEDRLKCQLSVAIFSSTGTLISATGMQLPRVIDELFYYTGPLGAVFSDEAITFYLWALTAQAYVVLFQAKDEAASRKEIIDRIEQWLSACEKENWLEDYNLVSKNWLENCLGEAPGLLDNLVNFLLLVCRWRRDGRSLVPSVLLFYMGFGAASRTSGRSCQLQPNMDVVPLGHRQTS